jgi:hypothetical protein
MIRHYPSAIFSGFFNRQGKAGLLPQRSQSSTCDVTRRLNFFVPKEGRGLTLGQIRHGCLKTAWIAGAKDDRVPIDV